MSTPEPITTQVDQALKVDLSAFSAYEIAFAQGLGATQHDIEDMCVQKQCEKNDKEMERGYNEDHEPQHDAACGCSECEMMLFEGECDENNDGGEQVRAEWREGVAKARVTKALHALQTTEAWIRSWIQRQQDYRIEQARKAEAFDAIKKAYVHVEGTSSWLKYGLVPDGLRSRLLKVPGVTHVDTIRCSTRQTITCRIHVQWPLPELNESQRDAHFRILLELNGHKPCTASQVMLISQQP